MVRNPLDTERSKKTKAHFYLTVFHVLRGWDLDALGEEQALLDRFGTAIVQNNDVKEASSWQSLAQQLHNMQHQGVLNHEQVEHLGKALEQQMIADAVTSPQPAQVAHAPGPGLELGLQAQQPGFFAASPVQTPLQPIDQHAYDAAAAAAVQQPGQWGMSNTAPQHAGQQLSGTFSAASPSVVYTSSGLGPPPDLAGASMYFAPAIPLPDTAAGAAEADMAQGDADFQDWLALLADDATSSEQVQIPHNELGRGSGQGLSWHPYQAPGVDLGRGRAPGQQHGQQQAQHTDQDMEDVQLEYQPQLQALTLAQVQALMQAQGQAQMQAPMQAQGQAQMQALMQAQGQAQMQPHLQVQAPLQMQPQLQGQGHTLLQAQPGQLGAPLAGAQQEALLRGVLPQCLAQSTATVGKCRDMLQRGSPLWEECCQVAEANNQALQMLRLSR